MIDKTIDFGDAIKSLAPSASWKIEDNDLNKIFWFSDDIKQPSNDKIIAEKERLENLKNQQIANYQNIKESAINKLKILGLTEEEAKAIVGL